VKERIQRLLLGLNAGIYEKETALSLALLASIAGESIFLLGPPGVAKSLVARRLKYAYHNVAAFEYLMSRFSTPDEIFGPVKISELKNNDKYERSVDHYLPAAGVVFLDEIWKAGPSIQNALLTIINEKLFRNGGRELPVPMKALVAASNELPAKDEGLEALWDRFLVRLAVGGIKDREKFHQMTEMTGNAAPAVSEEDKITDSDYAAWSEAIDRVSVPPHIRHVIDVIRASLAKAGADNSGGIYVSDRRWKKIVRLLRASAFLNDRAEVDLMDCFLIRYCIWHDETQIAAANTIVRDAAARHGYRGAFDFEAFEEELARFKAEIEKETIYVKDERFDVLAVPFPGYYEINAPPTPNKKLISQYDYHRLTDSYQSVNLAFKNPSYSDVKSSGLNNIRKGNGRFSIRVDDKEYQLKTITHGRKYRRTRKPAPELEKAWDLRVTALLEALKNAGAAVERRYQKEAPRLRDNLFVPPEKAAVVEAHVSNILKEIEKKALDAALLQNNYKKIAGEETVFDGGDNWDNG